MSTPTATIFLPYHALDDVILRGTRAAQPAATAVVPGTLYGVSDEGNAVERSSGAAWEGYSPAGAGGPPLVAPPYVVGDLVYADTTATFARRAIVAAGAVLVSGAVPVWSATPTLTSLDATVGLTAGAGSSVPAYVGPAPAAGYAGLWFGPAARSFANYSLLSDGSGGLLVNADAAQSMSFRFSNTELMNLSTGGLSFTPGTTVAGIGNITVGNLVIGAGGAVATSFLLSRTNPGTNSYISTDEGLASWLMVGRNAALPVFSVQATAAQAATIMEWLDSTGAVLAAVTPSGSVAIKGFYEGVEISAPAAGPANTGRLYFEDNGAGKTRLMCRFNTGAAQQVAIEP